MTRSTRSALVCAALPFVTLFISLGVAIDPVAAAPFSGVSYPAVVQDDPGTLSSVTLGGGVATLNTIGTATVEYNNMGYRSTDGFLYAVELTNSGNPLSGSNNGIVRIDNTGAVTNLGTFGLPNSVISRFDAGDVSADGTTMYISMGTATNTPSSTFPYAGKLFTLDLAAIGNPATTVDVIDITGPTGMVNDWAFNPIDGKLYGGDQRDGQLAMLDPVTGVRTDMAVAGLPTGVGYGAAWFEPSSGSLFLYRNNTPGTVYEVDVATKTILQSFTADNTQLNDGAYIVPEPATLALIAFTGLMTIRRRVG